MEGTGQGRGGRRSGRPGGSQCAQSQMDLNARQVHNIHPSNPGLEVRQCGGRRPVLGFIRTSNPPGAKLEGGREGGLRASFLALIARGS